VIASASQIGRLCLAVDLPLSLPTAPLYSFDAARQPVLALAAKLTLLRPWLREDAEQSALLAAWEATASGTAEVAFDEIAAAVKRAVRDVIDDLTEKKRESAETPSYTIDFAAEAHDNGEDGRKETLVRLRRLVEKYGVAPIVSYTRFRFGCTKWYSAIGAGKRTGITEPDALLLDIALRRINPAYKQIIRDRKAARKARKRAAK